MITFLPMKREQRRIAQRTFLSVNDFFSFVCVCVCVSVCVCVCFQRELTSTSNKSVSIVVLSGESLDNQVEVSYTFRGISDGVQFCTIPYIKLYLIRVSLIGITPMEYK